MNQLPTKKPARVTVIAFAIVAVALFANLENTPPPWWDEGWTLVVAKSLALHDLYARPLGGQPGPAGLSAQPPTTALVALAFRLFGVGLVQARLPMAAMTLLTLAILFALVSRLYDRGLGLATIAAAALMSMHPQANPIMMGRQVLAEPMMLLLLVVAALFLFLALKRSLWFILPALLCWGIVPIVKAQVLPFWAVSLAVPLGAALLKRQWRTVIVLVIGLVAGYIVYQYLLVGLGLWLAPRAISETPVYGQIETVAFVPVLTNRWLAISNVLKFEIPLVLGLAYGGWRFLRSWNHPETGAYAWSVQLALWSFGASWLAWYLIAANAGIPRYLYPPAFLGSIFAAGLLRDLTDGFRWRRVLKRAASMLSRRRLTAVGLRMLGAILLVALAVPFTLLALGWFYAVDSNTSAEQMAQYINGNTPPSALIESYDSELFFFLEHPYHYPPDQTHLDLIQRTLDPSIRIKYDPLAANPDYLVVGPFGSGWRVYDEVLAGDSFRLLETRGAYRLYQRTN